MIIYTSFHTYWLNLNPYQSSFLTFSVYGGFKLKIYKWVQMSKCIHMNEMIFVEYVWRYVVHVPDNLPLDAAAPLLCAGITVYSPMKDNKMLESPGKKLGIIGLGGLGHIAVKFGKAFGLHVTIISTSPSKEKEARQRLGADDFIVSAHPKQMEVWFNISN